VTAELCWWRHRFGETLDAVARLAAVGLRAAVEESALAQASRTRASSAASDEAGMAYWARVTSATGSIPGPTADTSAARRGRARAVTAEGELARLRGLARPELWRTAAEAWDDAPDPYQAAYARWRLAEALLDAGAERDAATIVLRVALATAEQLLAAPLARELEALARRARLSPRSGGEVRERAPDDSPRGRALALGLSDREVDVLEQILGVNRRGEAAAIAHRLGLDIGS
jgi:hypothetical protein